MKVEADKLADAIIGELEAYSDDVSEEIQQAVLSVAKSCVADIRRNAPKHTGAYAKGWKRKIGYRSGKDIRVIIHNPTHYRLAHLLEKPHAKRGGGKTAGHPHIRPAAEKASAELEEKAKMVVRGV